MGDARRPEDQAESQAQKRVMAAINDAVDEELRDQVHVTPLRRQACMTTLRPSRRPLRGLLRMRPSLVSPRGRCSLSRRVPRLPILSSRLLPLELFVGLRLAGHPGAVKPCIFSFHGNYDSGRVALHARRIAMGSTPLICASRQRSTGSWPRRPRTGACAASCSTWPRCASRSPRASRTAPRRAEPKTPAAAVSYCVTSISLTNFFLPSSAVKRAVRFKATPLGWNTICPP